jgi:hypothetical protein
VRRLAVPRVEVLEDRTVLNAGGGWGGGGLVGQYFANTTESGPPAFSRTDVRLDWAPNTLQPGGSNSTGFNAVPSTNWSAYSWKV